MLPFDLTILGSASATPVPERHQTAQVLRYDNDIFLLDCGEETQRQLLRYKIRWRKLRAIFISHLHGDHYLGLMGLLNTMSMQGRKQPLHLFAPPELANVLSLHFRIGKIALHFDLDFIPLQMGEHYKLWETEKMVVETIPLQHRIPCTGFLFREKITEKKLNAKQLPELRPEQYQALQRGEDIRLPDGTLLPNEQVTFPKPTPRSYAFCSDTRYLEAIIPIVKGADLLYHEATFTDDKAKKAFVTFHSTARQAATLASKAEVGELLIGHFSASLKDLAPLLSEAQAVFAQTSLALEGMRKVITKKETAS